MDQLTSLTAVETRRLLEKGEITPLELVDAALDRIAATDAAINAIPTVCAERAREHARKLMGSKEPTLLRGIPIAVKDNTDVAGVRTTYGSPIFADHVPATSNVLVETLERRGAIVVGKSNVPEFSAGAVTFNEVFGATRNPWNTRLTPGGSSGGSAAALAAGQVWLATGSDLGGSIRIPASFCGVVGLRPSPGRVAQGPRELPYDTLAVHGPMGRTVADVALLLDAMSGEHPVDPLSLPEPPASFLDAASRPSLPRRVAFSVDLGIVPVDPEVASICRAAVDKLQRLGIQVDEAAPDLSKATEVFQVLRGLLFATRYGHLLDRHRDLLKPEIIWNIERGRELDAETIGRADRLRGQMYRDTVAFFNRYDLLITPAVITPPFGVEHRYLTELAGVKFETYIDWLALSYAITLVSFPAISIPCGYTSTGLPVGVQIVGRYRDEAGLLSAAAAMEAEFGAVRVPIDPR